MKNISSKPVVAVVALNDETNKPTLFITANIKVKEVKEGTTRYNFRANVKV